MVVIFTGKRKKSVIVAMISIFSFITILTFSGYMLSYYIKNSITTEYQSFILNNNKLSKIPIMIDNCEYYFNQYLRNQKEFDHLGMYYSQSREIAESISSIEDPHENYKENIFFKRILSNMNDHQQEVVRRIISARPNSEEQYSQMQYLKTILGEMRRQSQFFLVSYLNNSSMEYLAFLKKSRSLEFAIHTGMFCFSVISLGIGIALSKGILNKIKQISKAAFLLSGAHWEIPDIKRDKYIELDSIAFAFNEMKNNIKKYIEEIKEKSKLEALVNEEKLINERKSRLLREAELEALQMQMNPHFLFNTLNMIKRVIFMRDRAIAAELIDAISNILRYNMDNRNKMVPLTDEISVLRSYILIQQKRFGERIAFELNISDNLSQFFIPPLILQPIVENAIIHGLKNKSADGIVKIDISSSENIVKIVIKDNGQGFEPEKLTQILSSQNNEKPKNIGILNVINRLDLQFGNRFFFNIESEEGKGAKVIIEIFYS